MILLDTNAGLWLQAGHPRDVGWMRDPFDRLRVAHAALRGWRLATGDADLLERLGAARSVEL